MFPMLHVGNFAILGIGPGMRQPIRLGTQMSCVIQTRTFLRRFDEVCQLLHQVGQLLYEVHLLTASGGLAGGRKFS